VSRGATRREKTSAEGKPKTEPNESHHCLHRTRERKPQRMNGIRSCERSRTVLAVLHWLESNTNCEKAHFLRVVESNPLDESGLNALGGQIRLDRSGCAVAVMNPLSEGVVLKDTYRVLRRLGGGGMGEVYEAEHTRLNAAVLCQFWRGRRRPQQ